MTTAKLLPGQVRLQTHDVPSSRGLTLVLMSTAKVWAGFMLKSDESKYEAGLEPNWLATANGDEFELTVDSEPGAAVVLAIENRSQEPATVVFYVSKKGSFTLSSGFLKGYASNEFRRLKSR